MQLNTERNALTKFRRALRKEYQLAFDELWVHVSKHLMAINHCNHLIPLESYLLAMVLEQQKQIQRLQREFEEQQE